MAEVGGGEAPAEFGRRGGALGGVGDDDRLGADPGEVEADAQHGERIVVDGGAEDFAGGAAAGAHGRRKTGAQFRERGRAGCQQGGGPEVKDEVRRVRPG